MLLKPLSSCFLSFLLCFLLASLSIMLFPSSFLITLILLLSFGIATVKFVLFSNFIVFFHFTGLFISALNCVNVSDLFTVWFVIVKFEIVAFIIGIVIVSFIIVRFCSRVLFAIGMLIDSFNSGVVSSVLFSSCIGSCSIGSSVVSFCTVSSVLFSIGNCVSFASGILITSSVLFSTE